MREGAARPVRLPRAAGHPLGFLGVASAGEVATGVLHDPLGVLGGLHDAVTPFPAALRDSMIAGMWQADFLLDSAAEGARRDDVVSVGICLLTAAMIVAHAWLADAGAWGLNEKGILRRVTTLGGPAGSFAGIAAAAAAAPGGTADELHRSIAALRAAPRPRR